MNEIAVIVPVYQRPHRIQPLIQSYEESKPSKTILVFVASPGDKEEITVLGEQADMFMIAPFARGRGDWARKINHGYRNTTADWILCAADDVHFHKGWDKALRRAYKKTGKHVLGTNDLNPYVNPDGIYSPHPCVHRRYADEWGTVDHKKQVVAEVYDHNYPDRELAATAICRDEWFFVKDAVIEHLHHSVVGVKPDPVYKLGQKTAQRDYLLHQKRHRLWERERAKRERMLIRGTRVR